VSSSAEHPTLDRIIDQHEALRIAQDWARGTTEDGVHTEVAVAPGREGWVVDLVAYEGEGPFVPLGTGSARITRRGEVVAA